ncbi:nucleotide-binding protein [Pseudomonas sp. Sample_20]|jgi:hypothetical protein|uniref:TIR domain-containing protein n=1 Tax=Pseudomonas sp. Sample_20 TaxID=2448264 RepID=UPI001032D07D|nr:nucleotide-binding protein [Pseudomonas sp. Sample_20]
MTSIDIFKKITNAVLDLQGSQHQTYELPLRTLAKALSDPSLATVNDQLTARVDLDEFLAASGKLYRGNPLPWPDNEEERLGLIILLALKMGEEPRFALNFGMHHFSNGSNKIIAGIHGFTAQILAPFVRDYKLYVQSQPKNLRPMPSPASSNKVFIVHGHDEAALQSLARFIERLGLKAIVLREMPDRGQTIIEKFETESDAAFAVVLLTPDDVGGSAQAASTNARARQNVIFELGYFRGKLGRGKVMLLKKGNPEIPSDLFGVLYTEMDINEAWQYRLIKEMKAAGLTPDTSSVL